MEEKIHFLFELLKCIYCVILAMMLTKEKHLSWENNISVLFKKPSMAFITVSKHLKCEILKIKPFYS